MTGASGMYPYTYAVLRAVPRVDRGEFVNVGVILYCQPLDFLRAAVALDEVRLRALSREVDVDAVETAVRTVQDACRAPVGSARANDGLAVRFGRLTAPRSTVVQPSPVHAGMTSDPPATLAALLARLVVAPA